MFDLFDRVVTLEFVLHYEYVDSTGTFQKDKQVHMFSGSINVLIKTLQSHKENFPYEVSVSIIQRKAVLTDLKISTITHQLLDAILV